MSQSFAWGYNEQPPLYTWLQMFAMQVFGDNVLSLSLLKNLIFCVTFIFYYKLGKLLTGSQGKAIAATLGLYLIPQIFWEAKVDQTHSVLVTMASVLCMYSLVQIVTGKTSAVRFLLFGLACGVGILSKYNIVLLLVPALFSSLCFAELRRNFLQKKLLWAACSFALITAPHVIWFFGHVLTATKSTVARMHQHNPAETSFAMLGGLTDLFLATLTFTALLLVVWGVLYRKGLQFSLSTLWKKYFTLFFAAVYALLLVLIVALNITSIKERWLLPYLIYVPLFFSLSTSQEVISAKIKKMGGICIAIAVLSAGGYLGLPRLSDLTKHASRIQTPFVELKPKIGQIMARSEDALVYAENYFLGGNIRHLFPERFVVTKIQDSALQKKSVILAFYTKREPKVLQRLQALDYACSTGALQEPYLYSSDISYTLNYQLCSRQ
nr:glycosyltransferase family 39 protein [Desulfobulbus rhabdoformis]